MNHSNNIMKLKRGQVLKFEDHQLQYVKGVVLETFQSLHSTMEQPRTSTRVLGRRDIRRALSLFQ